MRYINLNEASICEEIGTLQLLPCFGDKDRVVTMLHSDGSQGQFSQRKALTVATTGGHSYMQRCYDNMRSELTAVCKKTAYHL